MLTPRQKELLDFIERYLQQKGFAPTQHEMARALGIHSLGTLQKHLNHLVRLGRLCKVWNGKRALALTDRAGEKRSSSLPLLGLVAAGKPIEAIEGSETIDVPASMFGRGHNFVLKVKGDSMVEDGILDGDFVVVRSQETAENGQTVVAVLNGAATVKKFYQHRERIQLRPANSALQPIHVEAGDLALRGVVVGVIRRCE